MTDSGAPGALAGVRVVEFAQAMAVPVAGLLLGDMGAEVVKIEPPYGDAFRHTSRKIVPNEGKGFIVLNRGKRSVCLDVTRSESAPVIDALAKWADIILMSLKPPDLPRYNLGYERFAAVNPRLVYLEHIPNGPKGPLGQDGGYDVVVQGISGYGAIAARQRGEAPEFVRPATSDMGTGFLSALAVVAALRHRDLTGEGQRVQTSLLSTAITLSNNLLNWFAATDPDVIDQFEGELAKLRQAGAGFDEQKDLWRKHMVAGADTNIYFRHYRTSDGFVSVGALSPVLHARFRKAVGVTDPQTRDDFDHGNPEHMAEARAMVAAVEARFAKETTAHWIDVLRTGGVPCGPFNFPTEVFADPQVVANEFVVEIDHQTVGPYKTFAPPIRMDRTPTRVQSPSPTLDAHTDEVLAEIGFDAAAVVALREAGVVGAAPLPEGT